MQHDPRHTAIAIAKVREFCWRELNRLDAEVIIGVDLERDLWEDILKIIDNYTLQKK